MNFQLIFGFSISQSDAIALLTILRDLASLRFQISFIRLLVFLRHLDAM